MFYEVEETTTFNPNAKGTLITTGGGGELDNNRLEWLRQKWTIRRAHGGNRFHIASERRQAEGQMRDNGTVDHQRICPESLFNRRKNPSRNERQIHYNGHARREQIRF
ncbi:hypothetical protein niasHT_025712 [Heterodera trifolii]|uniref:Uncharacterized protein n=1 Tax=Heterodera trifolii TaxID=157864 RepID=A0ABD2K8E3_9BILA